MDSQVQSTQEKTEQHVGFREMQSIKFSLALPNHRVGIQGPGTPTGLIKREWTDCTWFCSTCVHSSTRVVARTSSSVSDSFTCSSDQLNSVWGMDNSYTIQFISLYVLVFWEAGNSHDKCENLLAAKTMHFYRQLPL